MCRSDTHTLTPSPPNIYGILDFCNVKVKAEEVVPADIFFFDHAPSKDPLHIMIFLKPAIGSNGVACPD